MGKKSLAGLHALWVTLTACSLSMPASAQGTAAGAAANFPTKPITFISPYPPGGGAEGDGRIWVQKLGEAWNKPVVMDYKPGAGGTVGANYVAKATPDGHTLVVITTGFPVTAAFRPDLPYDPVKDFAQVSLTHKRGTMLATRLSAPFTSFPEYLSSAKANPGKLNVAPSGSGSILHLVGAWLNSATDTRTTFVHYKGSGPLLIDLVAGRTDVGATTFLSGFQYVKAGKLRPLAGLSAERSPLLPDLRTVAEHGVADFDYAAWGGILAPARTPAPIVNKLSQQFAAFAKDPATIEHFRKTGAILICNTPEEFRKFLVTDINRWARLIKENGIQPGTED